MNAKDLKSNTIQNGWGVYRHIRLDKNEPFYIGIFKDKYRPYSKKYRNKAWLSVLNKSEYEVEILFENLTKEQAIDKEKEFICLYGRKDLNTGCLYNMTDGGEGANNIIYSKERNKKISNTLKDRKLSAEQKHNDMLGQKNRIKLEVDNIQYNSLRECAKALNTTHKTIKDRCLNDKFNNYNFI